MLSPYGMEIVESCLTCKLRTDRIFCDLPAAALQAFENIKYATAYPPGAVLFVEGQMPRGIFVLCKGSVKLSINSPSGRTMIVKLAEPGEVLGLSATISGKALRSDRGDDRSLPGQFREARRFSSVSEGRRGGLLQGGRAVRREVSQCLQGSARLGLSHSAAEKLATLLLEWTSKNGEAAKAEPRLETQTHARGNCADDRNFARNREPVVRGAEETSDRAVERLDAGDSQCVSATRNRQSQLADSPVGGCVWLSPKFGACATLKKRRSHPYPSH